MMRSVDFFLTVDEVAARTHMHPVTVRRLLVAKRITGAKVGRAWLVSARALAELIDARANEDEIQRLCDEGRVTAAEARELKRR